MAEQLAELNRGITGNMLVGEDLTTNIPNASYTAVSRIELKANHTYIVTASGQYSTDKASVPVVYRLRHASSNVCVFRNANGMASGGGASLSTILRPNANGYITFEFYQASGTAQTASGVNLMAYQLD